MKNQNVPSKQIQNKIKTRLKPGILVHKYVHTMVPNTYVYLWHSDSMQISTRTLSLALS